MIEQDVPLSGKAARHQDRRDHILDAASDCFLKHGFHSASMALIAAAAKMSVGQIYRYFTNKEDMISAIVARQLAQMVDRFRGVDGAPESSSPQHSFKARLHVADLLDRERAGLFVEIRAEAARNPSIAKIVRAADAVVEEHVRGLIAAGSPGRNDPAELARTTKFLMVIIEGLMFRSTMDSNVDRIMADPLIDLVFDTILSRPADAAESLRSTR